MKKVFSKKFLVPVMAMLLCVAVAFGTGAIAAETSGNANIVINVNPQDTVKKYEGSDEYAIFAGLGFNEWDMALGPDAIVNTGMSDAYFEINAQRIIKIKPKTVRFLILPYYLCFMDDADGGEERWTKGELNFNSAFMYNFWRYLEVFQAAGTAVELNWGYQNMKPMIYWFGIKDVPAQPSDITDFGMSKRSAPRDLQAFANNFVKLLDECAKRGFIVKGDRNASTIKYVGFYNEVSNTGCEFSAFGDKRIYWCKMLEYVHKALVTGGYRHATDRSKHTIAIVGTEHGVSPTTNSVVTQFNDYVYDNAYKKGYCDMMNYHQYLNWSNDPASSFARGTKFTESTSWCNDRWKMEGNGTYGTLIAETGGSEGRATYAASADGNKNYSGVATPFDGSAVSIAIGASLGGSHSAMSWFCHDNYFVRSANFINSAALHGWAYPSMTGKKSAKGKALGVEGVNSTFGEQIFTAYVPAYSKVAKSTVNEGNEDSVRLATYMKDNDTAVVAEFDYFGGMEKDGSTPNFVYNSYKDGKTTYNPRTVRINLGDRGGTYYKYVHEYPESSFVDSQESQNMFDGNAILPDGKKCNVVKGSDGNYYIDDTISANHCLVIYSTLEPAQQIALADGSREITWDLNPAKAEQVENGVKIKVDTDACVGLTGEEDFEFDVYRGMVDGYDEKDAGYPKNYFETDTLKKAYLNTNCFEYKNLTENGTTLNKRLGTVEINPDGKSATYKCATDENGEVIAKAGDTIAVRVKIAGDERLLKSGTVNNKDSKLQVYDTDVYAIAIIKIVDTSKK